MPQPHRVPNPARRNTLTTLFHVEPHRNPFDVAFEAAVGADGDDVACNG